MCSLKRIRLYAVPSSTIKAEFPLFLDVVTVKENLDPLDSLHVPPVEFFFHLSEFTDVSHAFVDETSTVASFSLPR